MSAWDYARITTARDAWAEARRRYPPPAAQSTPHADGGAKGPRPKPHQIRTDGSGPQFADE